MAETVGVLNVEVRGKLDALDRDLRAGEMRAKQSASRMESVFKLGAVVNGVRGAFEVGSAALKVFRGDTEGALDSLEKLPLGIGGAIASMRNFADEVMGVSATLKEAQAQAKLFSDQVNRRGVLGGVDEGIGRQLQAIREDEFGRMRTDAMRQFDDQAVKAMGAGGRLDGPEMNRIRQLFEERMKAIAKLEEEARAAEVKKMRDRRNARDNMENVDPIDFRLPGDEGGLDERGFDVQQKIARDLAVARRAAMKQLGVAAPSSSALSAQSLSATQLGLNLSTSLRDRDAPRARQVDETNRLLRTLTQQQRVAAVAQ